ncbi:MAG: Gfo/Idh/MocA family oxidoreductase [Mesorhizobium sp.]|nr:Gfo/Idh/MocA family oxidoreductase [Mesorhizobium sp.]MBL8580371.1 Gfo/Idh/MocA family oxidoreductase [Mesorhizobium sp.]
MTLNIAWIGCGIHATQMLLPQLVRHDVRLAALCEIDPTRLEEAGRQFGVQRLVTNLDDLLSTPGIDAVGMAVGPDQHLAFGKAALARGLPVFMEKPPSATAAGARELLEASKNARKPLFLGFMKRYSIGNKLAGNIIRSGRFGEVMGIQGRYMTAPGYFAGDVDYSGFFLHHCVHYFDLVSWLVGSPVTAVNARKTEGGKGRLLIHIDFDFENAALGSLAMGTMQSRGAPVERLEIMSDHQRIEIDNVIDIAWHRNPPFKIVEPEATLDETVDTLSWRPNFTAAANEDPKGYHAMLADVVKGLKGEESPAPGIMEGVVAMERLEAVRKQLGV